MQFTTLIKKGEKQYIALCPELDVVSEGKTVEQATANLKEAVSLHIEVIGKARADIKAGKFYTHKQVKKILNIN